MKCCDTSNLLTIEELRLRIGNFTCKNNGKHYFIDVFNNRAMESENNTVIMEELYYYIIADIYNEIKQEFVLNGYNWKHIFELGYIVISW